jgi:Tfp pilus assembly protein PilZ
LLDLDLTLEDGRRIRVTAKVVRIQYPQWGRVGGVGVAFTRFEGDSRAILEQYLDAPIGPLTSSPRQSPTQAA